MKARRLVTFLAVAAFSASLLMACGGSDSAGPSGVVYDGNTSPAVADSTTATGLTQTALDSVASGFPVVQSLFMGGQPAQPAAHATIAAQPLAMAYTTTVTMVIPAEAVVDGYVGTMQPTGTLTMIVGSDTFPSDLWTVVQTTMNGNMVFSGFSNEQDGQTVTGTTGISNANIEWPEGPVTYSVSAQDFTGDPGMFVVTFANVTFSSITVDAGTADAYTLGEGDLEVILEPSGVEVVITSLTVNHDGHVSKVEDTHLTVEFTSNPGGEVDVITIDGVDAAYGVVYDEVLGKFYFYANLYEEHTPGTVTNGEITLSTDGVDASAYYYIDYNSTDGSYYNLYIPVIGDTDVLVEKGWWLDWEMVPDPLAPLIT